jgi:hypothetical protein
MRRSLRNLLIAVLSLSLVACTTTRVVAQGSEASATALRQSPAIGDPKNSLIVVTKDGVRNHLRITSVDAEALTGTSLDQSQRFRIPLEQVQQVEVTEIDTQRILIVGVVVLVIILAAGYSAANSLAKPANALVP